MSFDKQKSVTNIPQLREMEITLFKTTEEDHPEGSESIRFRVTIDNQKGQPMNHLHGDLLPHLTTDQKTAVKNFLAAMWSKAEKEVV